jgi:hypothetical protein
MLLTCPFDASIPQVPSSWDLFLFKDFDASIRNISKSLSSMVLPFKISGRGAQAAISDNNNTQSAEI